MTIEQFLIEHPLISINRLEKQIGASRNTILIKGVVAPKYKDKVIEAMIHYGYNSTSVDAITTNVDNKQVNTTNVVKKNKEISTNVEDKQKIIIPKSTNVEQEKVNIWDTMNTL